MRSLSLRQMVVSFFIEQTRRGLKTLDPQSPCARQLKDIDTENVIKEDIGRICQAASVIEIARVMALATQFQAVASKEKKVAIKSELKKIAQKLVARVERQSGGLKMPKPCRDLLLDL